MDKISVILRQWIITRSMMKQKTKKSCNQGLRVGGSSGAVAPLKKENKE